MYKYRHPKSIDINLSGDEGFRIRQKAADFILEHQNKTGAQRGSVSEQSYGALAEIVIRNQLNMHEVNPDDHPLGYDILLPSGVKIDVKCRGGEKPFLEEYMGLDGLPRESKHNFFARQLYDDNLNADAYVMTHLMRPKTPAGAPVLPGTKRQRKWILYVCGWVSKKRVLREGVYLPPGAISERGREWFAYRAHEIEFYNRNLNGLESIADLLKIEFEDVELDADKKGDLNLTRVDTLRIGYDLVGRGVLQQKHLDYIKNEMRLDGEVSPFLHSNQSIHVLKWLLEKKVITPQEYSEMTQKIPETKFEGFS